MLLNAEIKDDNYAELPRQQLQAQYAPATNTYLRADASTGKNYVDLNAAAKSYAGAWLFGSENVECFVGNLKAQWQQWCPIPAGIADGVLLRGNVIYQNPDKTYRTSSDQYEGVIRTRGHERIFEGKTQHTFYGSNFPGGSFKVVANLSIPLTQKLAYNPMIPMPSRQNQQYAGDQSAYRRPVVAATYNSYQSYEQPATNYPQTQSSYSQAAPQYLQAQSPYSQAAPQYPQAQSPYTQAVPATYSNEQQDGGF